MDVVYANVVLPRIYAAFLLVCGILLIRTSGIAVEGEKCPIAVMDVELIVIQILYNTGTSEIPCQSHINNHIHNFSRMYVRLAGMGREYFFYYSHG
jgi:hypothetical protein